jgi:branched-subunit amino acid permease
LPDLEEKTIETIGRFEVPVIVISLITVCVPTFAPVDDIIFAVRVNDKGCFKGSFINALSGFINLDVLAANSGESDFSSLELH